MEETPAATDNPLAPDSTPFRVVGFLLSQLGYQVARRFQERLAPLGLKPRHFAVMRHISGAEGASQQALGEALGIPASRMVALIDELDGFGFVERRMHPSDRRMRALYLTPEGRQMLGRAIEVAIEHERDLCGELSPSEREQLLDLLGRVAASQGLTAGVHPGLKSQTTPQGHPWGEGRA